MTPLNNIRDLGFPWPGSWKQFKSNWRKCISGGLRYFFKNPFGNWYPMYRRLAHALVKKKTHGGNAYETSEGIHIATHAELLSHGQIFMEENLRSRWYLDELKLAHRPVIVDVGAAYGYVPIWLSQWNWKLQAYCFDPYRSAVGHSNTLKLGITAFWYDYAVCDVNGPQELKIGTISSLARDSGPGEKITVPGVTLDSQNIPDCFLLKIDTDGSNHRVLLGARKLLERTRFVLIEEEPECDPYAFFPVDQWRCFRVSPSDLLYVRKSDRELIAQAHQAALVKLQHKHT